MGKLVKLTRLKDSGLVAVIRRPDVNKIHNIVSALIEGGVGALEITVDTPNAFQLIEW